MMRYILLLSVFLIYPFTAMSDDNKNYETAIFAGGCFWCMEPPFDRLKGVISTTSGYTGGIVKNPNYTQVSSGVTGHTEAMEVVFDPEKVSYDELLNVFWRNIDPFDSGGQFCDRGEQYRSEIFYLNNEQKELAEESKAETEEILGKQIVTSISKAEVFYPAENYHQGYYQKNPVRYKFYRHGCGRDKRLQEIWGEPE